MKLNRFQDTREFFDRAREYLLEKELIHSLLLRVAKRLADNPQYSPENSPYLAIVENNDRVVAVALRTPPRNLILSQVKDLTALEKIAEDVYKNNPEIPGVTGLKKETEIFVKIWKYLTGRDCQISMKLRIHKLEKVRSIANAKGHLALANQENRDILLDWAEKFYREATGTVPVNINKEVDRYLKEKNVYFWQDNKQFVSFVNASRSTLNSADIGPVYTPPEYRRKGYATAMVAELSQKLLDRGFKYCLLFTDLANPTSNNIYRQIGYEPVSDWNEYSFLK